jgi:DNA-binding CsgD family transcriptional regulator
MTDRRSSSVSIVNVKLSGWGAGALSVTTAGAPAADPMRLATVGEGAARTARVAERALSALDPTAPIAPGSPGWNAIRALVAAESYDAALHALDRVSEVAHEQGSPIDVATVRVIRAEFHLRVGDLAAAEADARALHETSGDLGWPAGEAWAAALLCDVLVERGELDEAASLFVRGEFAGPARTLRNLPSTPALLVARGRLRRALGQAEAAAEDLREAGRRATGVGLVNPALLAWRSELALAVLELDDHDEARRLAADELALARVFGAPRAIAVALRTRAAVAGDRPCIAILREAVEILDDSPARVERARALLGLGRALRQTGSTEEARDLLRLAVDLAHRCGAHPLEDDSLDELRAAGARPRRAVMTGVDALTRSERRITELAAAGRLNREIAEEQFVTVYTVEFHLRNAYRKLGITSRTELAEALAPADEKRHETHLLLAA